MGGGSNNIDRSNVEPIIPNHPQDQTNNVSTSTDTTQKDELNRLTETSSSLKKAQEELKRKTAEFKALKDAQATTEKQLTDASNSLEQIQSDLKEKERVFEELQRQNQLKLQELSETHQKLTEREQLIEIINQKMSDTVESMGATLDNPWLMEKPINHDQLPQNQLYTQPVMALYPLGEDSEGMLVGDRYLYKQQYSVVYARNWLASLPDGVLSKGGRFSVNGIGNLFEDEPTILPSEGSATYRGKAFNANNMGDLTYRVDFEQRTGQGEITNFSNNIGHITLHQGSINDQEIKADASMAGGITGKYTLGFFGPNGEEIAGDLYIDSSLDNSIPANGGTRKKYEAKNRGVAFGLAAQKESQQ